MTESNTPSQESAPVNAPVATTRLRKQSSGPSWSVTISIVLLLLVLLLGAGTWFQQKRFDAIGREVATQVQSFNTQLADTRREARQALALADSHVGRIGQLELALRETQNQYSVLEQAWETFNKGMEDSMLANDLDRLLTLASQQLRLAGNVNNAIMALETALSTLVRADRPKFSALQRAINTDLDRLRAVPLVDVAAISVKLEAVNKLLGRAPLLVPDTTPRRAQNQKPGASTQASSSAAIPATPATPATSAAAAASATPAASSVTDQTSASGAAQAVESPSWWENAWTQIADWTSSASRSLLKTLAIELTDVVSIQRVSDANALLLSPEQGVQLRANLRARLLTAQMALMMHQTAIWRAELDAIEGALLDRFDPNAADTIAALRAVGELSAIQIAVSIPDIVDSIVALEAVRLSETNSKNGN